MPLPTSLPTDNTEREGAVKALVAEQIAELRDLAEFSTNLDFAFLTQSQDASVKGVRSATNNTSRSRVRSDLEMNLRTIGGNFAQLGALFAPGAPASTMTPANIPPVLADKAAVRAAVLEVVEDAAVVTLIIDQNPTAPSGTARNPRIAAAVGREGQAEEDGRAAVAREVLQILCEEVNAIASNLPMPPPAA